MPVFSGLDRHAARLRVMVAAAGVALALGPGIAYGQTIELRSADGGARTLDRSTLAAMPQAEVVLDDHGETARYEGVPLVALARLAGAPTGEGMRGAAALSTILLLRAADGYRVVLAVSDVDPSIRPDGAILALTKDGRDLDAHEGPYRAVIGGDARPARSARQVTAIEVQAVP
ncbi:molybdopterin-dependent oxidoreductase [Marinivivus vitaminiproducens]|uniref:molybdopterin-dependent oxidoreductase n=1 Tax=Marinivivus vitaminiproducens TaxID=3035935 RepID=UPI00279CDC2E|nr:hypothetical protein P4R82_12670 [Geminicoccaceae bacterium SCSIO 64248]